MTDNPHPLDRLTAAEMREARGILADAGLITPATRFPALALIEPDRDTVFAFQPGDPIDRKVGAVLLNTETGQVQAVTVSVTERRVLATREVDVSTEGQPSITGEEFELVGKIVKADPDWLAALAKRGIDDVELVCVCPLSAGNFADPEEHGKRMLRCLSFNRSEEGDLPWAHPIDGLVAYVDVIEQRVTKIIDNAMFPVPAESGNFGSDERRTTLRPIEIHQPEGPSFTVEGDLIQWQNWTLRVGFNAREGLVLHQLAFDDRPVLHRASIAEMVVPYGDPSPVRYWQNYFDSGEYNLGQQANSLELGCDCLGEIHYFDADLPDDLGEPQTRRNVICLHEEDFGVLWKHSDIFTGMHETRRARRLVVSFFATVGNYDYGFYWYLYLDGTIELEAKATGIVFTGAHPDGDYPWGTKIAPGLAAPNHQHLFCARLDMTIDGRTNAVDEEEVRRIPTGPDNPYGNAITRQITRLHNESDASRLADNTVGRAWRVSNPSSLNRLGSPVGYTLIPQGLPPLVASGDSVIAARAAFATRHLWVTQYHADERYPAGELINQNPGGAGLPAWQQANRNIDDEQIVLWHTFGLTHFPRTEDWPVMPVDRCGFTLRPTGFLDRNPTLDV
ncbi:MAG TPA: primary-amine oxidase [Pseudonocardiaceae bacterium]|nr:primary-amine oxidase [Pseudonocardiaceae bacterium]